jgi:cation-transporting ATPase F
MHTLLDKHWHHLPADEVLDLLGSNLESGLDVFEVKHRQQHFGPNVLTPKRGKGPLVRFLLQFDNPLLYILLMAGAITAVLKDAVDAGIIFGVVLVNAIVGFIQESKAEKAIEALAQAMTTEATVVRSGKTDRIPAAALVPGDIVLLQAGNKVPADMRLVRARELQVIEAALTGESLPIQKAPDLSLAPDTVLADRRNMGYTSTLVTYGQGAGVVVAIGDTTEVGRISQLISTAQELETPLTRKIAQFSRVLLYVILALAVASSLLGIWRGQPIIDTLMAAIALAVAAIPEGLPAAVTVTLAIGVSRMARRRAIIRKLPAVETLGSTTVICSDKTGTLTQNQMTVQQIVSAQASYEVTGVGYQPSGQIVRSPNGSAQGIGAGPAPDVTLLECLKAGLLCNDSQLVEREGRWEIQGDPTEGALVVAAHKAGLSPDSVRTQFPRLDTVPFEADYQYMATLHEGGVDHLSPAPTAEEPGTRVAYVKGAAEAILEKCNVALDESGQPMPLPAGKLHAAVEDMAARGLRVLALARRELPAGTAHLTHADVASGLTFLGLQGMMDPPRPEAVAAVQACQAAGIRVKMITGDHALTAAAIARQIGLDGVSDPAQTTPAVLTGKAIAEYSDEELIGAADRTLVFARVTPEQKLRLVEAIQARGHIVAMTGDGVNDAPALKQADIGVAMGISGTDVSKEAADMVLTDDNFASIEAAVEEGRGVFDNLTKIIAWTLPTNLGEGLVILAAILAGVALPILPAQILWINMTTVGVLGLVLALEPKEPDIMRRPPRDPQAPILTRELLWRVLLVGTLILAGAFGLFELEQALGSNLSQARTVAVNVVVAIELFYLFNCRSLTQSLARIGLLSNRWVILGVIAIVLLQLLFTYTLFLNELFSSAPIGPAAWGRILAAGLITFVIVEIEKWVRRRPATGQQAGAQAMT